jgi:hypothetical protein
MAYRLKTPQGRKLYALRKQTPETVGIIKSVMGLRQTLLRGLKNVQGEWNLVAMSWNIKRMFALQATGPQTVAARSSKPQASARNHARRTLFSAELKYSARQAASIHESTNFLFDSYQQPHDSPVDKSV